LKDTFLENNKTELIVWRNIHMSIGVFVAGRLNSMRLPKKLILPIGDSCLWDIACRKLNNLPGNYNKYALAENGVLAQMAEKYSNIKVILRSEGTARADSPLSFIFGDLKVLTDKYLMFLNPCQSLLTSNTIVNSLRSFEQSTYEYGTSVKALKNWLFDETGKPLNPMNYKNLSTKEICPVWQAANCFHIFDKNKFFYDGYMLKSGHMLLPVPGSEAIDVDTYEEYRYVRWIFESSKIGR
jgi:CMP-N-acetylneuraminic acid synthetase